MSSVSIRQRIAGDPHPCQLVQPDEVEEVMTQFAADFGTSQIKREVTFDTTSLTPDTVLDAFLKQVRPALTARDLVLVDSANS